MAFPAVLVDLPVTRSDLAVQLGPPPWAVVSLARVPIEAVVRPTTYTPQLLWLLMGPVIGVVAGGIVGIGVMLAVTLADPVSVSITVSDVAAELPMLVTGGVLIGGFLGAITGFFAGVPFIFLVGRHLARPVARRRAFALGIVVPPFAMLAMFSLVHGDLSLLMKGLPSSDGWGDLPPLLVSSLLGGPLAAWAAGKDELPKPVS